MMTVVDSMICKLFEGSILLVLAGLIIVSAIGLVSLFGSWVIYIVLFLIAAYVIGDIVR